MTHMPGAIWLTLGSAGVQYKWKEHPSRFVPPSW
jgi:hypothetical protein